MPRIATWSQMPFAVRDHLIERMRDRNIGIEDLNRLRVWLDSSPEAPEGPWFKGFGSFKLCGKGRFPTTFLLTGQTATGRQL